MLCELHLRNIDSDLPILRDENLTNILLYGNQIYDDKINQIILMHVIRYIKDVNILVKSTTVLKLTIFIN